MRATQRAGVAERSTVGASEQLELRGHDLGDGVDDVALELEQPRSLQRRGQALGQPVGHLWQATTATTLRSPIPLLDVVQHVEVVP